MTNNKKEKLTISQRWLWWLWQAVMAMVMVNKKETINHRLLLLQLQAVMTMTN